MITEIWRLDEQPESVKMNFRRRFPIGRIPPRSSVSVTDLTTRRTVPRAAAFCRPIEWRIVETPSHPASRVHSTNPPAARRSSDPWMVVAIVGSIALIVALQLAAGAYRSDFDGFPDEAPHLVSGLMVYDFLTTWPSRDPMGWAINYYLHYPKVAIGHWPPGFPLMEALWWLVFGPSRWSTILLEGALTVAAAIIFYRLARSLTVGPIAFAATMLLICAPVTRTSFSIDMADIPCLLWTVLLMDATVRILRGPATTSFLLTGLWLTCAILTKGTGVCLIPVPAISLILAGKWRNLPLRPIAWTAGFVALSSTWYLIQSLAFHHSVTGWGGMSS